MSEDIDAPDGTRAADPADGIVTTESTASGTGTDHLIGLRGKETLGPRWQRLRDLNNAGARLSGEGRNTEAAAKFQEAYRETLVEDLDAAGFDGRARTLGNLAVLAEGRGDTAEALRLADEGLQACLEAERQVGDRHGTVAVRTSILIHRAQTLQLLGRLDESLADLDEALELNARNEGHNNELLDCTIQNSRSVLFIGLERWDEAEAAARHALALASAHDPRLTGHPYSNLALIAQQLNDHDAAMAYLQLAEQVHAAAGDRATAALAVANQGRVALRKGDVATGERLLAAAERAFQDGEQPLRAAEIRYSRAHAAFTAGKVDLARELLPEAIELLRRAGHATMLAEAQSLHGDLLAVGGSFKEADAAYLDAWAVYEAAGARYHLARVDMRRAFAVTEQVQRTTSRLKQYRLLRKAFDLSLPSALATDAVRHQFAPGRAREQWAATVAIPAMAHALSLATALRDGALVSELLEHMSATVSLHAPVEDAAFAATAIPDTLELLLAQDDAPLLSFTASALVTGTSADFPAPRFALPPRLRVNPNRPSQLEPWIRVTEQRYGFAIRSEEVVDTW